MKIVGIDSEKCVTCKECVKECPSHLFSEKDNRIEYEDPLNRCILCGHCLAVCPTNAVIAEEFGDLYEFEEAKDPSKIVNYETFIKMIRARRSIRRFKSNPIPQDQIDMILQAMRYAPSASNAQNWNYIVITDTKKIKYFCSQVMKIFYLLRKILKIRRLVGLFVSGETKRLVLDPGTKESVQQHIDLYEAGKDPIFYDAPCVIVLHAPKYGNMAGIDGGIAMTHGMLAAQTLGIGTCWVGFALETIQRNKNLRRKWLKISKRRNCFGVMAFGYPAVKFHRAPERKELQVLNL